MEDTKQYTINNVQQLFSLNQNLINFKTTFSVVSLSNEPFMGIVVDQQTLDSGDALQFKTAEKGIFSGDITQDNNVPTNWYLVLKSTKPNKVNVDIKSVEIPASPVQNNVQSTLSSHPQSVPSQSWSDFFEQNKRTIMMVGVGLVVVVALFFGYRYYKRVYKNKTQSPLVDVEVTEKLTLDETEPVSVSSTKKTDSPISLEKEVAAVLTEPIHTVLDKVQPVPSVVTESVANELGTDLLKQIEKQLESVKLPPV